MTKEIKGDLVLTENTEFSESIKVKGNIIGNYNLKVNGDLKCWNLDCLDLDCWNLDCKDLKCWNLNCLDLDCWNLNCLDLDCWNLNCLDLKCLDLDCKDLKCWNLNCKDLDYFAVAVARQTFKCESVKGRRDNHIHLCLDSEIKFKN